MSSLGKTARSILFSAVAASGLMGCDAAINALGLPPAKTPGGKGDRSAQGFADPTGEYGSPVEAATALCGKPLPLPPRPDAVQWGNNMMNGVTYQWRIHTLEEAVRLEMGEADRIRRAGISTCDATREADEAKKNPASDELRGACVEKNTAKFCGTWSDLNRGKAQKEAEIYIAFHNHFKSQAGIQPTSNTAQAAAQIQNQVSNDAQKICRADANTAARAGGWKKVSKDPAEYDAQVAFCAQYHVPLPPRR